MRVVIYFYKICLAIFVIALTSSRIYCIQSNTDFSQDINITNYLENNLRNYPNIIYTTVPRGIVISINSYNFFDEGQDTLKESSRNLLDLLANLIIRIDKPCVIECNTSAKSYLTSTYNSNWELSIVRADKIVEYLTQIDKISPSKIRANGYGELQPFYKYKKTHQNMQERIDFVILNYTKQ